MLQANSEIARVTDRLLEEFQAVAGRPRLCILIDFEDLTAAFHGLIADLASLPWEAMARDREPLEQTHALVIARQIYSHRCLPSLHRYSLHSPARVLAVTPVYDPTGRMRVHEERARPYRPTSNGHSTPFVWCDCPPVEPGVATDTLQEQIEQHEPHVLHFFGHGIRLTGKRDLGGRSMFTLQVDGERPGQEQHLSPGGLRFALRSDHLSFVALFACLGGAFDPQAHDQREHSVIAALTERIPAVLAMATRMPQRSAGLAGETLYAKLAQGAELLEAVHAVRGVLWGDAQAPNTLLTERKAWFVPVLYLHGLSASCSFADVPELRAQQLLPLSTDPEADTFQDQRVDTIVAALVQGQHVLIHGPQGSCRTTLLSKVRARLSQASQRGTTPAFLIGSHITVSAEHNDEAKVTVRRAIAAALAQARGEHVYWKEAHLRLRAYLNPQQPGSAPLYLLVDDCEPDLAEQLIRADNAALRCVLVAPGDAATTYPNAVTIPTLGLKPPASRDVSYAWYVQHIEDPLRVEKLRLLHLLLEVRHPLKHQEIQEILKLGDEVLIDCVRSLSSRTMHYAVQNVGLISTRVDPLSWEPHENREKVVRGLYQSLQHWCDEQWKAFEKTRTLPESMLRILSSSRLRGELRPVPVEPVVDGNMSDAYRYWLALIRQAQLYDGDIVEQVAALIMWRSGESSSAAQYTQLDRWMLEGIVLTVRDLHAAAERDEDTMPIDEASVTRVLRDAAGARSVARQQLREAMQQFWAREVLQHL